MANSIIITSIRPTDSFVTSTSRYASGTVIYYGNQNKITFKTYKRVIPDVSPKDRFIVLTPHYEFRPDLLSNDVYGQPDFWWKIMEVNSIKDIFNFKSGLTIRIPNISEVF